MVDFLQFPHGLSQKTNQTQTLRAVTIRQIWKDNANMDDDTFKVDGVELSTVGIACIGLYIFPAS